MRTIYERMVSFCKELISIPSLSGKEGEAADFVLNMLKLLKCDEVWRDDVGNIVAKIAATNQALPSILFTSHLDHVDPGNFQEWPYDPYSGDSDEIYIYGVGASDAKGAIATQVFIPYLLKRFHIKHGDIFLAFVVCEENGGLGTRKLLEYLKPEFAIMGEASANELRNGNRGRALIKIHIPGEKKHASMAQVEETAIFRGGQCIVTLKNLSFKKTRLGPTICIPTKFLTENNESNVTPSYCEIILDCRLAGNETEQTIIQRLKYVLPNFAKVELMVNRVTTYTNKLFVLENLQPPFWISSNHPLILEVKKELEKHLKKKIPVKPWRFTTDCGFFAQERIPIVGFSPGEEQYAHTNRDRIKIALMKEALDSYPIIIRAINKIKKKNIQSTC